MEGVGLKGNFSALKPLILAGKGDRAPRTPFPPQPTLEENDN